MKDQVFSGKDVAEAISAAARSLGLPPQELRYVVLDAGAQGAGKSQERPAQIAVLLDRGGEGRPAPAPSSAPPAEDPQSRLRGLIRVLAEAADLDLEAEIESRDSGARVRLRGEGSRFFLEQEGEVLRALQQLLQRALGHEWPGRLIVECAGYAEMRDAAIRDEALATAAAVREDGRAREIGPLNSYERRIVHVALADAPGVRTFSVGEGADRRVTVAPAAPEDDRV